MQLVVDGESEYALPEFSIDRVDHDGSGKPIIQPGRVFSKAIGLADQIKRGNRSRGSQS